jgi:hypothetical protein
MMGSGIGGVGMSKLVYGKLALTEVWKGLRINYWRETTGTYIWTISLKNGHAIRSGIHFPELNDALPWARRAAERRKNFDGASERAI